MTKKRKNKIGQVKRRGRSQKREKRRQGYERGEE
jgi:hypothetical protein